MDGMKSIIDKYELHTQVAEKEERDYLTRVYEGISVDTGDAVIIKEHCFLNQSTIRGISSSKSVRQQLRQEKMVLEELKRRTIGGVTKLIEYEEFPPDGSQIWMVLEKAKGDTIGSWIENNGPLAWDEFKLFCRSFLTILANVHQAGIIHRDIGATNIFIKNFMEDPFSITILDFGLAYFRNFGIRHAAAGTSFFAPPEAYNMAHKKPLASFDVYSTGVLCYYLLTGRAPYPMPRLQCAEQEQYFQPLARPDVPVLIEKTIKECLRFHEENRPYSGADLRNRWKRIIS